MSNIGELRHVVVTPSRNESAYLPELAESMAKQSIVPSMWIVVLHNSEDESRRIMDGYSKRFDWISVISVNDNSKRKRGGQIASLVNKGLELCGKDWVSFQRSTLTWSSQTITSRLFLTNSNLLLNSELPAAPVTLWTEGGKDGKGISRSHQRGLKTYRRQCLEEIGGIMELDGWDGIDNIMAQMAGWETKPINRLEVLHQRTTGSHSGVISGCFESGRFAHSMGYYPLFMFARSIHRMARRPFIIGGISMFMGYSYSILTRQKRQTEPTVVAYLRKKQKTDSSLGELCSSPFRASLRNTLAPSICRGRRTNR